MTQRQRRASSLREVRSRGYGSGHEASCYHRLLPADRPYQLWGSLNRLIFTGVLVSHFADGIGTLLLSSASWRAGDMTGSEGQWRDKRLTKGELRRIYNFWARE